jgi:hypothetical protein
MPVKREAGERAMRVHEVILQGLNGEKSSPGGARTLVRKGAPSRTAAVREEPMEGVLRSGATAFEATMTSQTDFGLRTQKPGPRSSIERFSTPSRRSPGANLWKHGPCGYRRRSSRTEPDGDSCGCFKRPGSQPLAKGWARALPSGCCCRIVSPRCSLRGRRRGRSAPLPRRSPLRPLG